MKNVYKKSTVKRDYENTIADDHPINEKAPVSSESKRNRLRNDCDPQNIIYPFNKIVTRSYTSRKKSKSNN